MIMARGIAKDVDMEVLLDCAPIMVESARRNRAAIGAGRANPEVVELIARQAPISGERVDNPYISVDEVVHGERKKEGEKIGKILKKIELAGEPNRREGRYIDES